MPMEGVKGDATAPRFLPDSEETATRSTTKLRVPYGGKPCIVFEKMTRGQYYQK